MKAKNWVQGLCSKNKLKVSMVLGFKYDSWLKNKINEISIHKKVYKPETIFEVIQHFIHQHFFYCFAVLFLEHWLFRRTITQVWI